jgi:DNA-binding protein H-NS
MATYNETLQQIDKLREEADKLKIAEKLVVIEEINSKIKLYGITSNELVFIENQNAKLDKRKSTVPTKYYNPATGQEWSGRGSTPKWLVEALNAGKKKEDFLVSSDFISKKTLKKADVKPRPKTPKKSLEEQFEDANIKYHRRLFNYVLKLAKKHFADLYKKKRILAMHRFKGWPLTRSQRMKLSYDPQYVGYSPDEILIGGYVRTREELVHRLEQHGVPYLLGLWEEKADQNVRVPKILLNPPKSDEIDSVAIADTSAFLKKIHEKSGGMGINRKDKFKGIKV